MQRMDIEEENDLVDLLVAFLEGYDPSVLDRITASVRVRLALAANGEGGDPYTRGMDVPQAA